MPLRMNDLSGPSLFVGTSSLHVGPFALQELLPFAVGVPFSHALCTTLIVQYTFVVGCCSLLQGHVTVSEKLVVLVVCLRLTLPTIEQRLAQSASFPTK